MKAGKVLDVLQISRTTLKTYREKGYLKAIQKPTGQFDYDPESVYLLKISISPDKPFYMPGYLLINKSRIYKTRLII